MGVLCAILVALTGCVRTVTVNHTTTVTVPAMPAVTVGEVCQWPLDYLSNRWPGTRDGTIFHDEAAFDTSPVYALYPIHLVCDYHTAPRVVQRGGSDSYLASMDIERGQLGLPERHQESQPIDIHIPGAMADVRWSTLAMGNGWAQAPGVQIVAYVDGWAGKFRLPCEKLWTGRYGPDLTRADLEGVAAELVRIIQKVAHAK